MGIIEKLRNLGRDPEEERKVKAEADLAAKKYEEVYGKPDYEAPAREASFLGFLDPTEVAPEKYRGVSMGSLPSGSGPKGNFTVKSFSLKDLREAGLPESRLKAMADEISRYGSTTLVNHKGELVGTVGRQGAIGQEFRDLSVESKKAAAEKAPVLDYQAIRKPAPNTSENDNIKADVTEELARAVAPSPSKRAPNFLRDLQAKNKGN